MMTTDQSIIIDTFGSDLLFLCMYLSYLYHADLPKITSIITIIMDFIIIGMITIFLLITDSDLVGKRTCGAHGDTHSDI